MPPIPLFPLGSPKHEVVEKLKLYYQCGDYAEIPTQRPKAEWVNENQFGFLCGVLLYGHDSKVLLIGNAFSSPATTTTVDSVPIPSYSYSSPMPIDELVDFLYDLYIRPFKKNNGTSCYTPASSISESMQPDPFDDPSHASLKKGVLGRDKYCLFCWRSKSLHAAHIIAQKLKNPNYSDDRKILGEAGLQSIHEVNNGMLLCSLCHDAFDKLEVYVEIVDNFYVVKYVKTKEEKGMRYINSLQIILTSRVSR